MRQKFIRLTAFQNVYLHELLLDREVSQTHMLEHGYDMFEFAKSMIKDCKKVSTQPFPDWLTVFVDKDEYKEPINKFIALIKPLKDENNRDKRIELLDHIRGLVNMNKNRIK
jgi:hypothetical protein